jgi:uncharacterized protein (DUF885 family)
VPTPAPADPRLLALCADYWAALMRRFPVLATTFSVHDHDHLLEDLSPGAKAEWARTVTAMRERALATSESDMSPRRRVTRSMLLFELDGQLATADLDLEAWSVDQLNGPQVSLLDLARLHAVTDEASAASLLSRVRAMPRYLEQHAANLERGRADGRVAAQCNVVRVIEQLDDVLSAGPDACSLVAATARAPLAMPEPAWQAFRADLRQAVALLLMPAFEGYRDLLRDGILPRSRTQPGLLALPGGDAVYRALIRIHVTLDREPQELHDIGLREVARIRAQMETLAARLFPGRGLAAAARELREDRRNTFGSREEIVQKASSAVRRATEAARRCFALLPDHECVVTPIDPHAEKSAPAAFYLGPAPDGSRPGTYFVNTYEPTSRPRHEAEVVAFHEAVPGHHLQIALAQGMPDVPEFQKHCHATAYVEGWALYTERLADELGLYSGDLDLLGMMSCDAWRASRLVVDTGLHALGWSREQAIAYMAAHTTASLGDIEVEVDRYVAWPAQALSYKMGQIEILALRRDAEAALGPSFDLKEFHRAVLEHGGVTLPILRSQVEAYVEGARSHD